MAKDGIEKEYAVEEVVDTIKYFIENAANYHIDTDNIFIMGYSAGGYHAMAATLELHKQNLTIKGQILCYAFLSDMLGHNYTVTKTYESTCTGDGYSVYVCTRCGDTYNDDVTSANGHSFGSWYTVTDSDCLTPGTKRRDCVSCGAYETGVIEAKEHNHIATVTEPTCTEQGYTTHVCDLMENRLYCGDCLEILPSIPTSSIDFALYFTFFL